MKNRERWEIIAWAVFSVGVSLFLGCVGMFFTSFWLSETYLNSSASGDYAEMPRSAIVDALLAYCAGLLVVNSVVLCFVLFLTHETLQQMATPDNQQFRTRIWRLLLFINAALLIGAPVVVGLDYWRERAPYFPKATR